LQTKRKKRIKRKFGEKEGNMPIPLGSVVTVDIPKVDRGPTDTKR
jgi:hypothetical protein